MFAQAKRFIKKIWAEGGRVAIEWPANSGCGWDLDEVKEFEREHAFRRIYFDGCMLGVHGKECPIRKPWCVSSCGERILTIMAAYQCDHSHQHEPAEGSQTKQTGFDTLHKTIRIGYRRSIVCSKMVSTCSRSQHFLCTCDIESDKVATVQGWKGNQSHQSGSRRFESLGWFDSSSCCSSELVLKARTSRLPKSLHLQESNTMTWITTWIP